jgi:hypothetical protein
MNIKKETVKRGFLYSLHITWELSKVIVPAFILVTLLKHTPVFNLIADWGQPLMKLFGLPGEAAMPITIGMFINQYLAIGALSAMDLTAKEITISALILCICHELPVESAVVKRTGVDVWLFVLTRFVFAFLGAYSLNVFWNLL